MEMYHVFYGPSEASLTSNRKGVKPHKANLLLPLLPHLLLLETFWPLKL